MLTLRPYCRIRWSSSAPTCFRRLSLTSKLSGEQPAIHNVPSNPVRTRFAPSPTGDLHLGSLRTAAFNYLIAKRTGGQFILRIEDTDQKRTIPGAEEKLCSDLQWAGLQWDEGPGTVSRYGPYKQSERTAIYQAHAEKLLKTGHAYRCFCSVERLGELARQREAMGLPTDYDRACASISHEESHERAARGDTFVIRLLIPNEYPAFHDLIYRDVGNKHTRKGESKSGVTFKRGEVAYEDPILLKSDGQPTYHLANVVDDHFMDITHVIRGTEWLSSTPKHAALYEAFGWKSPKYAHVGLLVDSAGQKFSKRNGRIGLDHLRSQGYLPEALVNFVSLLGWSHREKSDVMTLRDLEQNFTLKFTRGDTKVEFKKLYYLQRFHAGKVLQGDPRDPLFRHVQQDIIDEVKSSLNVHESPDGSPLEPYVQALLKLDPQSYTTPAKYISWRNKYFFVPPDPTDYNMDTFFSNNSPRLASEEDLSYLSRELYRVTPDEFFNHVGELSEYFVKVLKDYVKSNLKQHPKKGDYLRPWKQDLSSFLRWILFGGLNGPSVTVGAALLGKEEYGRRVSKALESIPPRNLHKPESDVCTNS